MQGETCAKHSGLVSDIDNEKEHRKRIDSDTAALRITVGEITAAVQETTGQVKSLVEGLKDEAEARTSGDAEGRRFTKWLFGLVITLLLAALVTSVVG